MSFDDAWRSRWGDVRPLGHELRRTLPETWVRFHSLPGSKRVATTAAEYDEVLSRHLAVLRELGGHPLQVITASWSDGDSPLRGSTYWRTLPTEPVPTRLFVGSTTIDSPELAALLRLVADDVTADVILAPPTAEWLYHPYDGGGDVIAPDVAARDRLRSAHLGWLSAHPEGL